MVYHIYEKLNFGFRTFVDGKFWGFCHDPAKDI